MDNVDIGSSEVVRWSNGAIRGQACLLPGLNGKPPALFVEQLDERGWPAKVIEVPFEAFEAMARVMGWAQRREHILSPLRQGQLCAFCKSRAATQYGYYDTAENGDVLTPIFCCGEPACISRFEQALDELNSDI